MAWINGFLICYALVSLIAIANLQREVDKAKRETDRLRELLQYKDRQISQLKEGMMMQ